MCRLRLGLDPGSFTPTELRDIFTVSLRRCSNVSPASAGSELPSASCRSACLSPEVQMFLSEQMCRLTSGGGLVQTQRSEGEDVSLKLIAWMWAESHGLMEIVLLACSRPWLSAAAGPEWRTHFIISSSAGRPRLITPAHDRIHLNAAALVRVIDTIQRAEARTTESQCAAFLTGLRKIREIISTLWDRKSHFLQEMLDEDEET